MLLKFGFLVLFASVLAIPDGDSIPPAFPPEPRPSSNSSSTTAAPNATTTTTTLAPNVTTTTLAPNVTTSTAAPNVTTTSTAAPNVTTTTAAPTPVPPATVGKWFVKDANNVTCILASLAIQVNVTFDVNKTQQFLFDVSSNASASGTCENSSQSLVLALDSEGNSLLFEFQVNGTNFVLSRVLLNMTYNASALLLENDALEFPTPLNKSYHCAKNQEITLKEGGNKTAVAILKINSVQWEAFHTKSDENFSAAEDCSSSTSPDIVPIAVGCALVGLVAIVLIAYLVGRRRSQARGYLSM